MLKNKKEREAASTSTLRWPEGRWGYYCFSKYNGYATSQLLKEHPELLKECGPYIAVAAVRGDLTQDGLNQAYIDCQKHTRTDYPTSLQTKSGREYLAKEFLDTS